MKIGITGARGSGKSDFAEALAGPLSQKMNSFPTTILDGYIEDFQLQTDLAAAQYASYVVNMEIAMYRLVLEQEHFKEYKDKGNNLIVCGTMIDTSIYLAVNALNMANTGEGQLESNLARDLRSNATMHWFGMMRTDAWNYDYVFYLPLGDKRDEDKDPVAAAFDDLVIEAYETFHVPFLLLDQDTAEEKVEAALKYIQETNEAANRSPAE